LPRWTRADDKGSAGPLFPRDRGWHPPAYTPGYKTSMTRAPQRALVAMGSTLTEETAPVFGHDTIGILDNSLILNFTGQRL
jgi:protocatechuate 3,4-dioxygenase beta subunit